MDVSEERSNIKTFRANILAQLDQYLPYYDTDPEIRNIFNDTMTKLHEAEIHPNTGNADNNCSKRPRFYTSFT